MEPVIRFRCCRIRKVLPYKHFVVEGVETETAFNDILEVVFGGGYGLAVHEVCVETFVHPEFQDIADTVFRLRVIVGSLYPKGGIFREREEGTRSNPDIQVDESRIDNLTSVLSREFVNENSPASCRNHYRQHAQKAKNMISRFHHQNR